jgi:ribosome-binding protein aMBF1 (putative translation factor)
MAFPVKKLEVERRKRFMSQWDLARSTGIIQTRLSLIERGEVKPKEQEIRAIAKVLGLKPDECFEELEHENPSH